MDSSRNKSKSKVGIRSLLSKCLKLTCNTAIAFGVKKSSARGGNFSHGGSFILNNVATDRAQKIVTGVYPL